MNVKVKLLALLDEALHLEGRSSSFDENTPLLGALPELDSMAVLTVITLLEERFGITIADDAIDSAAFGTLGSLAEWLSAQVDTV